MSKVIELVFQLSLTSLPLCIFIELDMPVIFIKDLMEIGMRFQTSPCKLGYLD